MPFTGTDSDDAVMEYSNTETATAAGPNLRAVRRVRILFFTVQLLRGRLVDENLGFGPKIDDLEAERIPSARLRVLRGIRIGVLNGGHPVGKCFSGVGALARGLQVSDLCKIRQPAGACKEAHRVDLHADRAAILVHIEWRFGIGGDPLCVPGLIAPCGMKSAAFLVVAFRGGEVETLADGQ